MAVSDPAQVGRRVVVRYRLPTGSRPPLTDVVGVVTAADDASVTVDGTRGGVTVRRQDIVALKAVPPRPVRRGRPHTAIATPDLERLMSDGWRAVEEAWLGEWLLRASSGFTSRGNSVLPLGDPGVGLEEAIGRVEHWYAARGLPPRFQLVHPAGAEVGEDALFSALASRGYATVQPTLVMTGATADIGSVRKAVSPKTEATVSLITEAALSLTIESTLSPPWLAAYARQRDVLAGVTEQVLTGSAEQLFVSLAYASGAVAGVARLSLHPGWAGLQALWVDPALRGRGLGRRMLSGVGALARQRRLAAMFLQVEVDNEAAISVYASEGFRPHHTYVYAMPRSGGPLRPAKWSP